MSNLFTFSPYNFFVRLNYLLYLFLFAFFSFNPQFQFQKIMFQPVIFIFILISYITNGIIFDVISISEQLIYRISLISFDCYRNEIAKALIVQSLKMTGEDIEVNIWPLNDSNVVIITMFNFKPDACMFPFLFSLSLLRYHNLFVCFLAC